MTTVRDTLADLAHTHGYPAVETVVLPTALLVSVPHDGPDGPDGPDGAVVTAAVSSGRRPLMLHQVDALADTIAAAVRDRTPPDVVRARVLAIRTAPGPYGTLQRLAGYVLLCTGLAALLQGSWADVVVAAVAGAGVGAVLLAARRLPDELEVVLTVGLAFAVSLVVFLLARTVPELGVLPSVVAPLVLFLPGGLLTTGVIELSTGQMLSGAGRVAAGTMQLVLLALGIVAAGSLVGLPSIELSGGQLPLGPLAPWAGVVLFGVGTVVFRCGRPASIGWVLLVLSVAYGAQVLGDALLGGVLSAFVGALVMTPVALAVARFPSGPSPLTSFLPAFWMLVPGALGLVGVTTLLDGDSSRFTTLVTTAETMVAIALGVLLGLMLGRYGPTLRRVRRAG
ncbi:threonine/serine exporter family protein [Cellulomonas hominis]